jgi:PKD repeat protein
MAQNSERMRMDRPNYNYVKGLLIFLFLALVMFASPLYAQTLSIRSAVVAPGDTVTLPVEITGDVQHIYGFQIDLDIIPSSGAPNLTIQNISKGAAATTAPNIDSNPLAPAAASHMRIGLPTEIPSAGNPRPNFSGPGAIVAIQFVVPSSAVIGQSYQLNLSNVILAGPGNLAIPLTVFGGAITVGGSPGLADTISCPPSLTVGEGETEPLVITVTGNGQPIPGVGLQFLIDDPSKATLSASSAVTGADGKATIYVTGIKNGITAIRISSPGLGVASVAVTVIGVSPMITSTPPLEVNEGSTYTYNVTAIDPNGDPLTYALLKSPPGMTIDPSTGVITWTPPAGQPQGGNDVTVQVSDPQGHTDTQSFSIWIVVDADGDGYDNRVDCDDHNPAVHPGAVEVCNGIDDNCDGQIDEGVLLTFYRDSDGDGYGDPSVSVQACTAPAGYVANNTDCDDTDPAVNPGMNEIGDNGKDDDCNPSTIDNWSKSFVVSIDDGGRIYYAKSNGDGTFSNYKFIADIGGYNSRGITINDFNNDGYLDFIAAGGVSGRVDYYLFLNDGNDNFYNQGIVLSVSVASGSWAMDMTSGDINNDGNTDFIGDTDSGQVVIALGDGKGGFTSSTIDLGGQGRGLDIADFNNDGIPDFVRGRYGDGLIYVFTGRGDGTFNPGVQVGVVGNDPYGVVAADFDNDGIVDIIANTGSGGDPYFFKGNGIFTAMGYAASLDANNYSSYDAYDFNNDGNVDVVVSDYSGYKMWYYPGIGDGTFGPRVQINASNTSSAVLAISAPPYRTHGTPFALIKPQKQTIPPGTVATLDGSASHDVDGTIAAWNWDFGDGGTATGDKTSHTYGSAEGLYNVTLKVTDNSGQNAIGSAKVYVQGTPPVAHAGGPYTFGEAFADNGIYTATLDSSGSTDDSGIVKYEWDFGDFLKDTFDGTTIDPAKWIASAGLTQNEAVTFTGTGSWGARYLFSQGNLLREAGVTLEMHVKPVNTTGNQYGMFGFKNTSATYSYTQMPYAVYFNNGAIYIYEDGNSRGQVASYVRGQEYEIKIVLKAGGASYYIRNVGDRFWNLIYDSTYSTDSYVKAGADVNSGTFTLDDVKVSLVLEGEEPTNLFTAGTYPVTLTVTDTVGQTSADSTTINVVPGNPPVANPGGPYSAGEKDAVGGQWFISFDGSRSSDDYGIIKYEWDFDASNGIQVDATSANPIHMYDHPGTYTVTLKVTDNALQTSTATTQVTITTSGNPPVADTGGPYTVNEESAAGGILTLFLNGCNSTDDVGISRYVWDFGDGTSMTTYYCGEKVNGFAVGTDLYGYDVSAAGLRIIASEDNTKINIINLTTGTVVKSSTLNRYGTWWDASPGDGIYFKVESDKPVMAYESNFAAHSAFVPSLESGPVGHQFTVYYYTGGGYYVFAYEDTTVTFFNTSGTQVVQKVMAAGTYWNPGLTNNTVYRVYSSGKISMQNGAANGYTMVPASNGDGVGRLFYAATTAGTTGAFVAFAYEDATVSVYDMDTNALLWTQTLTRGNNWFQTGIGTKRLRIESTGDIEVWAGDTEGGSSIIDLGDDISFASGKQGQEFYLNTLRDGAVIFAPYNDTEVNVDGTIKTLNANQYWHLAGGGINQHITSTKPVVIQTLGRANTFNDLGTFLGGRSAIKHYYAAKGTYNATLTVYDNAGQSQMAATTVTVNVSQPPVADPGGPYVLNESNAAGGVWTVNLDGTKSTDDYGIYKYEWDFDDSDGIQVDGTGPTPTATYTTPGVYTVTLRVYDQAMQMTQATTTVTVLADNPPVANAGGPYTFGEEAASFGVWTANLDGSRSTDDFGIYSYDWLFGPVVYNFSGTVIDDAEWNYSSGVTQSNGISAAGAGSWGNRYFFSGKEYERADGVTFQARVLPDASSSQAAMFGFKKVSSGNSYTDMPHAIYLYNGTIYIYEDGSSRGNKGSYTRNTLCDIKIVLKHAGASYYYKQAASDTWTLLYDSSYSTTSSMNIGMTVYSGTYTLNELTVIRGAQGVAPSFEFTKAGTYPITLTVKDNALQSSSDTAIISINDGQPPVADAGGPYTAEVGSLISFDGSGSTDDNVIETYEWTFGDTSGLPVDLPYTGKGVAPRHVYHNPGTYNVTLKVTDNTLKTSTATTTVNVVVGNRPVANAGGPYTVGAGKPVYFDGSGSSDDYGIVEYRWDVDAASDSNGDGNFTNDIDLTGKNPFYSYGLAPTGTYFTEDFGGTTIDTGKWIAAGATQNDNIAITGSGSWGSRYIFSKGNYDRGSNVVFQGQVQTVSTSGEQMMWGLKDSGTNYSYSQMPHAIYFNGGNVYIYENGSNRGQFGTYARGVLYDLKIELKSTGARYYYKQASEGTWTKIYESTTSITTSPMKVGATVATGTFWFDNFTGKADPYVVTLTVEDGAGQTSTATTTANVLAGGAPDVITVPWVANDPTVPHETYNGKSIRLKGIVRAADPVTYQWDFGDGTKSTVLNVTNPYDLSIAHTYPDAPQGTPFVATLTVWDSKGQSGSDTYNVIVKSKSLNVETNIAIDEGLWYLHQQQTRTTTSGYPSGYWQDTIYSSFYSSPTASAIQAFEINGHMETGNNQEDPYVETVSRGLKYLFSKVSSYAISDQTYGNPDSNGNGIGIGVNESYPIYQGGPVMDAIASSNSPLTRTVTGGANVARRTYFDILTDMADMFAWGQYDDATVGGGWRYNWGDWPDNSASQWGAIGMQAAEDIFGVPIPQWVKDRNDIWLSYSYNGTGFGYTSSGNGVATTPSGMVQLAFDNKTAEDTRWKTAENYIASQWSPTNSSSVIYNPGSRNYYAMYAFTKAMRLANPKPVINFKYNGFDWYNDPNTGMARSVINDQASGGKFQGGGYASGDHMRTAWGVIILSQTLFIQSPVADAGRDRVWGVNIPLTFDGSGSYHPDPFRKIVKYEWDFNGDGVFDSASSEPTATYTYTDNPSTLPKTYRVTLRVTDNNTPPLTDTDTVNITIAVPPHPPIAVAGGPYKGTAGLPVTLDGSGSYDIDPTDFISRYEWELNNVFPYDFGEATGAKPTYVWNTPGTYNIGLRVWDNGVMNDLNGNGMVDENERLSDQNFTTITIVANEPPVADAGGPYVVDEGTPITLDGSRSKDPNGDPISYNWDLDNDGRYNDGSGAKITHTFMRNGTYTVGLQVTDTLLTSTATATVTVNDLAPKAAFTWTPQSQSEGSAVNFVDQSTSYPDAITGWNWDFGGKGSSAQQNPSFTFDQNGTYHVTLTVTDEDGSTSTISHDIGITNAAPTVNLGNNQTVNEGDTVHFSGSFTDPGALDSHTIQWNFGDGSAVVTGTLTPSHVFNDNGVYSVTLTVTDDSGGIGTGTVTVTVNNVAPSATLSNSGPVDEGSTVTVSLSGQSDPSSIDMTAGFHYAFACDNSSLAGATYAGSGKDASTVCTFNNNGAYPVRARIIDKDEGYTEYTTTVQVNNVAPSVNAGGNETTNEGGILSRSGFFSDPGSDTWTATVDYGDGSGSQSLALSGKTFVLSHPYLDNGTYTVTVTVTDSDGGTVGASFVVTVNNVPPNVEAGTDQVINEGDTALFSGSFTDPGTLDTQTIQWNFGDGSAVETGTLEASHIYVDNGVYMVTLTVTDKDGGIGSDTLTVTANNVPPKAMAGPNQVINEGDTALFSGSFTDPGTFDTHTTEWDFGDGNPVETGTLTPSHTYADNGIYTATLTVTDKDGGVGSDTLTVTVNNVPPMVEAGSNQVIIEGATASFSGSFTDPGILDTHTTEWDFGDGSPFVTGTLTPSHTYADNGVYTITLTVTDKDGGVGSDTLTVTANKVEFGIPGQCVPSGEAFACFDADDNVTVGTPPYRWTWSGNVDLTIAKDANNVVCITYPTDWIGNETITFTMTDANGITRNNTATYTVDPVPIIAPIPEQISPFVPFDLDTYLSSIDPTEVSWSYSENSCLQVSIDAEHVATVSNPNYLCRDPEIITFTVTATPCGRAVSKSVDVKFTPNRPPDVSHAYASQDCLWPPNHKMVPVSILGVSDPDGDPVSITITGITSDEPTASDEGSGGSLHAPDASGVGTNTAIIRAERSGNFDGRVYVINFVAVDGKGGSSTGAVVVKVPHDQSADCSVVDSGQKYDATQIN